MQPSYACPTQDFQLSQWRKTPEGKWNALSLSEMHQVFNSTTGQIFLKRGMKIHGPQNCIELNLVSTWSFLWCHLGAKISHLTQEISQEFTVTFTQHIHAPLRMNPLHFGCSKLSQDLKNKYAQFPWKLLWTFMVHNPYDFGDTLTFHQRPPSS